MFKANEIYTFINPYSYQLIRNDSNIDKDFVFGIDGISLVWLHNVLHRDKVRRLSFDDSSLAPTVFNWIGSNNYALGIIGSSKQSIESAGKHIKGKYPEINLLHIHDGFFDIENDEEVYQACIKCDVIICSMGTPLQEKFLLNLRDKGWKGTGFTCGGYFDQLVDAGGNDYYPGFIDRLNLRWLYRIYKEPKRLWKRYVFDYPKGMFLYLKSHKSHDELNFLK